MEEIKEGDVVYLKSEEILQSSQRTYMTVGGYNGASTTSRICYWFVNGEIKHAPIPILTLSVWK